MPTGAILSALSFPYFTDFASYTMQHALEQLKELLGESSPFQGRLPNSISFKDLQQKLEEVQTVAQLCEEVLGIEGAVSLLGSGPRGDYYHHDVHNTPVWTELTCTVCTWCPAAFLPGSCQQNMQSSILLICQVQSPSTSTDWAALTL